ncbi:hypothetical protein AAHA92_31183 [Salvia divinorum]|uniref:Uncharacterized protein n=1 Tax=Salvia divinorum TaxID=28513 RepID=A0ABD1FVQ2_SALDI
MWVDNMETDSGEVGICKGDDKLTSCGGAQLLIDTRTLPHHLRRRRTHQLESAKADSGEDRGLDRALETTSSELTVVNSTGWKQAMLPRIELGDRERSK